MRKQMVGNSHHTHRHFHPQLWWVSVLKLFIISHNLHLLEKFALFFISSLASFTLPSKAFNCWWSCDQKSLKRIMSLDSLSALFCVKWFIFSQRVDPSSHNQLRTCHWERHWTPYCLRWQSELCGCIWVESTASSSLSVWLWCEWVNETVSVKGLWVVGKSRKELHKSIYHFHGQRWNTFISEKKNPSQKEIPE